MVIENPPQALFTPLTHYGAIHVTGNDAASFLQGQLTNDITDITSRHGKLAAYCNQQGRVIALFAVIAVADGFLLFLPYDLLNAVLTRLRKFVVAAKVVLQDVSADYIVFGGYSDKKEGFLTELQQVAPSSFYIDLLPNNGLFFYGAPIVELQNLQEISKNHFSLIDKIQWNLLRMQFTVVEINQLNSEKFLPHYLNLVKLNVVNFKKGCYTGQEIIARMQFRGTIKKHLLSLQFTASMAPTIDEEITTDPDEVAGTLVEYQEMAAGRYRGLLIVS